MPWLLDVVFARVEACRAAYDAVRGHHRTRETIDASGDELGLFRV